MSGKSILKKSFLVLCVLAIALPPSVSYARGRGSDRSDFHHYRYYDHPRFGLSINYISPDYSMVLARGTRYYYYDGLYYAPQGNVYVLTQPPLGAVVRSIPPDFRPVLINGRTYFVDNGVYYLSTSYGYQVVTPPVYVRQVQQPVYIAPVRNQTKVAEGSILGAILGALTGGIIGHQMKGHNSENGALLGGAMGAVAGGVMGSQIPNEPVSTYSAYPEPEVNYQEAPATVVQPAAGSPASPDFITVNVPNQRGSYTPVTLRRSGTGFVGPQGEYYPEFPSVGQLQAMYGK
jgi:hypothetical protein